MPREANDETSEAHPPHHNRRRKLPREENVDGTGESWFGSLFGSSSGSSNGRSSNDLRDTIHSQLNEFEELQLLRKHRWRESNPPSQSQQSQQQQQQQQQSPHDDYQQQHPHSPREVRRSTRETKVQNLDGFADRLYKLFDASSVPSSKVSYRASDGAYYVVSQDAIEGARIDIQPPFMIPKTKENGGFEVFQEPGDACRIWWRKEEGFDGRWGSSRSNYADQGLGEHIAKTLGSAQNNEEPKKRRPAPPGHRSNMIELDDYVDCSRISASVYRTRNLLTLKAPVKQGSLQPTNGGTESSATENSSERMLPRTIPVVKRS